MTDDPITSLAKILPVKSIYDDLARPVVKQVGHLLEDSAKTIRVALFFLQYASASQDRYRRFLEKSVRKIPEERRVSPPPQILGPSLEGIRYEPEDTPIDEMFSNLLSGSMDRENYGKAHPSFPVLISQLSSDEAIILELLRTRTYKQTETLDINPERNKSSKASYWTNLKVEIPYDFPLDRLFVPVNLNFYTEHLYHLGLACYEIIEPQEPIFDASGKQTSVRRVMELKLMPLGRSLTDACIPNPRNQP